MAWSFWIRRGETFSLVGESGCGKSTLARVIAGLDVPTAGAIRFADAAQKGHRIQMIFQDPYASLNPRYRVGTAIAQPIRFQKLLSSDRVMPRVHELLRQVGLAPADAAKFPHEFSGGQRQRVSIARALAGSPTFLVCDEPTSALDVSVQADPQPVRGSARVGQPACSSLQPAVINYHHPMSRRDVPGGPALKRHPRARSRRRSIPTRAVAAALPRLDTRGRDRPPITGDPESARSAAGLRTASAMPTCKRAMPR
jgi:peptide/nickel transport system ATP-binding protein